MLLAAYLQLCSRTALHAWQATARRAGLLPLTSCPRRAARVLLCGSAVLAGRLGSRPRKLHGGGRAGREAKEGVCKRGPLIRSSPECACERHAALIMATSGQGDAGGSGGRTLTFSRPAGAASRTRGLSGSRTAQERHWGHTAGQPRRKLAACRRRTSRQRATGHAPGHGGSRSRGGGAQLGRRARAEPRAAPGAPAAA